MQKLIYYIGLQLYYCILLIASLFSKKAKLWIAGRNQTHQSIVNNELTNFKNAIWIHASSLGEFEQARPLIEKIKLAYSNQNIVVTFYSPSGYEYRKDYALANKVYYLPYDTSNDVKKFIDQLNPKLVIWVRYEFWYYTLQYLHQKNIPVYLISASFRSNQLFFKNYGQFYRNILLFFKKIFVINTISQNLLKQLAISNTQVIPDTRMDRVMTIANNTTPNNLIEKFLVDKKCLIIAGSTWQADIDILIPFINKYNEFAYMIAPHQLEESNIKYIEQKLTIPNIRYSKLADKESIFENVLIIDNMGMLASLYKYGKYTYVGGGFGVSVHNVLEAIVYKKPVFFGPHFKKQFECSLLIDKDVAQVVYTSEDITKNILALENDENSYQKICMNAHEYVLENKGGTDIIYKSIFND